MGLIGLEDRSASFSGTTNFLQISDNLDWIVISCLPFDLFLVRDSDNIRTRTRV